MVKDPGLSIEQASNTVRKERAQRKKAWSKEAPPKMSNIPPCYRSRVNQLTKQNPDLSQDEALTQARNEDAARKEEARARARDVALAKNPNVPPHHFSRVNTLIEENPSLSEKDALKIARKAETKKKKAWLEGTLPDAPDIPPCYRPQVRKLRDETPGLSKKAALTQARKEDAARKRDARAKAKARASAMPPTPAPLTPHPNA